MIYVNMHAAKTRLSELVRAVEEDGETVILCRAGRMVAEIRPYKISGRRPKRNMDPDPRLAVTLAPGYDPAEPLTPEEWPDTLP
jgi:antitoxin (DNA-binding transcriptional repressor) of toxin-antitoxin stability system